MMAFSLAVAIAFTIGGISEIANSTNQTEAATGVLFFFVAVLVPAITAQALARKRE